MTNATRPPTAVLRELAVKYQVDPHSIVRSLDGFKVRGMAGQRAAAAVAEWRASVAAQPRVAANGEP